MRRFQVTGCVRVQTFRPERQEFAAGSKVRGGRDLNQRSSSLPYPIPLKEPNPKALRPHILRVLGSKTILYGAFGLF